jgi:HK97 family phage portal protein
MGIFSALEERLSPGPSDDFWYEPVAGFRDNPDVTPIGALQATPVWAAVNLISGTIGSLPLITYRDIPGGGKVEATDRRLYDLLRWQPNRHQTAVELFEMGQGHLCLRGNAFFRLEINRGGELASIVALHPDRVKLKLGPDGGIEYHYDEGTGKPRLFSEDEVLHVKGLSPDGLIGYSPITIGAGSIAMNTAAERYGARFFENSATPSGILSHPGKLKPEARSNIKASWQAAHGKNKQHSVALLEEGLSWTALSITPEEAQFLETRRFAAEDIARLFNVPPHLLMLLDRSTFNNVVEQNRSFSTLCVRPWAIRWEQAIRRSILERFEEPGLFVEFSMDALMRPDAKSRSESNAILLQNGTLTIDEWRARENLNPLGTPAGETHWMPLNIAPVSVAEAGPVAAEEGLRVQLEHELRGLGVQVREGAGVGELRSLANRRKIGEEMRPLIEQAAKRLVRREAKVVRRMMKKQLADLPRGAVEIEELRGTDGLFTDLEEFYHGEFTETIAEAMLPVIRSFARQIYTQAAIEIGYPPDFTPELEEFVGGYVGSFARHHAQNSRQQLQSIISQMDFKELLNELELRLAQWEAERAQAIALKETTEGNGAFTKFAYVAGGVTMLRWVTTGADTCPFCKRLSGAIVGVKTAFVQAGQTLETDVGRLTPRRMIGHPPLHSGCDCLVSPGL